MSALLCIAAVVSLALQQAPVVAKGSDKLGEKREALYNSLRREMIAATNLKIKDKLPEQWPTKAINYSTEKYFFPVGRSDKVYLLLTKRLGTLTYSNLTFYSSSKGKSQAMWSVDWRSDGKGAKPWGGLARHIGLSAKSVTKQSVRNALTSLDAYAIYSRSGGGDWHSEFFDAMSKSIARRTDPSLVHEFPTLVAEQKFLIAAAEN